MNPGNSTAGQPAVSSEAPAGFWRTLAWAVYLASSWTWVIGMFFPILLTRDFGIFGWFVFAVPNVLGAAAVGFVTFRNDPGPSAGSWKQRHATMLRAFSQITFLFQIFGVFWLVGFIRSSWALVSLLAVCVAFLWLRPRMGEARAMRRTGVAVYTVSVIAAVVFLVNGGLGVGPFPDLEMDSVRLRELLYVSPGIVMGFLFCPHMDLTLQRVRDELTPGKARLAFAVGFCVFFLGMIFFTLLYSGFLFSLMNGGGTIGVAGVALGVHIVTQGIFTLGLHQRQAAQLQPDPNKPMAAWLRGAMVLVLISIFVVPIQLGASLDMSVGEAIYRCFLGFYGLIFPAYLWTAMVCRGWEPPGPGRTTWLIFGAIVAVTLPMFAAGFLWRWYVWLTPAVAVVLIVPVLTRNVGREAACRSRDTLGAA